MSADLIERRRAPTFSAALIAELTERRKRAVERVQRACDELRDAQDELVEIEKTLRMARGGNGYQS